ncbi:hypothetical protein ACHAWX_004655 [Stephanocyclus meneghinianus]
MVLSASKTLLVSFLLQTATTEIFTPTAAATPSQLHHLRRSLEEYTPQICTSNGDACPQGYFCKFEDEVCNTHELATLTGICTQLNFRCTRIYRPVCGCDNQTYANSCLALSHGVSVSAFEACVDDNEGST